MTKQKQNTIIDPDRKVMTVAEWCALNGFSTATGKRLMRRGHGPKTLQLSSKRIGVTVAANREWQDGRVRS